MASLLLLHHLITTMHNLITARGGQTTQLHYLSQNIDTSDQTIIQIQVKVVQSRY